jgi:cytochrome c oxidase assembly protein subunit 15
MLMLIFMGGLVTGFRAGMAVPDWPSTFGVNMFLYPLAEMTGGIFYEHAHRLLGSVVGLTTLTLAILLTIRRRPLGAVLLIWAVGLGVAAQGIMGGLRVTENNPNLAVVHGFFAHVVLAGMVCVAVLLARRRAQSQEQAGPNINDRVLSTLLVVGILYQTLLGALVRQKNASPMEHIAVAMFVIVLAVVVGIRLWGLYPHIRVLAQGGVVLIAAVVAQLVLGGIALAVRTPPAVESPSAEQMHTSEMLQPAAHAIITTLHQTNAAVILGIATLLAVWCWRLRRASGVKSDAIDAETDVSTARA